MSESEYSKYLGKKISTDGQFIFRIEFIDVPSEGIVTSSKINPDYFPGPQVAADVTNRLRQLFMSEMERIGAFKPRDIIVQ